MSGETTLTIIGNLVADPEMRFTPSGAGVANFTIASTPRTFDKNSNEWKDGETLFLRSSIWRDAAENVAESLSKGMRVIASGVLKQRTYEKDGEKKTVYEFEVDEIGPSLKYATAKVTRTQRKEGGGGFGGQQGGIQNGQPSSAPVTQTWGGNQPAQNPGGWSNGPTGEPVF